MEETANPGRLCRFGGMSNVYLVPADRTDSPDLIVDKLAALWRDSGLEDCFVRNDLTALKLHVGEPGTKTFVRPFVAAALVKLEG